VGKRFEIFQSGSELMGCHELERARTALQFHVLITNLVRDPRMQKKFISKLERFEMEGPVSLKM